MMTVEMMFNWNSTLLELPKLLADTSVTIPDGMGAGIESINSQQLSVGIFIFLMIAIAIFAGIIFTYMFKDVSNRLKTGEKWLFAWLFVGIVVAVAFGAAQMVNGYLF